MAAIDPSAEPETEGEAGAIPRATLKLIRQPISPEDEESENSDDEEYMRALLAEADSDEESDEEEEEAGPSDPSKSKKARKQAAIEELMKSIDTGSDDDMEDAPRGKGKAKSNGSDDDEEEDSEDDDEDFEVEEFVICTLDPAKVIQSENFRYYLY